MIISGKVIFVTGGASGLGEAVVRRFVKLGAEALFVDLARERGDALAAELGPKAVFVPADVTKEEDVAAAIQTALDRFGHIDIVANIAGIGAPKLILGKTGVYPLDIWNKIVQVDLVGSFNVLRLGAEAMTKNEPNQDGERGVIVNTSSVASFHGEPGQTAYSAAKGGINSISLPAARELARYGIRVMAIAPGMFETPIFEGLSPIAFESLKEKTIFPKRLGRPDEFAQAVQAVVENPMFNGDTIRLDGAIRF